MPHLDSKGPDGEGNATGRGLGHCRKDTKSNWPLGHGMGMRRKSSECGEGSGKRLKSGKIFDNE